MIVVILAALLGLITGLALAWIAPEELAPGKKYFVGLKYAVFIITVIFILFNLSSWFHRILFFILVGAVIIVTEKTHNICYQAFTYLLFITASFFILEHLVLSVLLFIYGLPIGSLYQCQQKRI
tara:strand:+ start:2196 stop:2567 length:372 start_codon:yes stop_codon:yes gene_type:complete